MEPRMPLVLRVLPYAGLLALVVVAAGIGAAPVTNPDTYFHLRFGAEFWGHWSPWHPGTVTRFATRDWLPTQWLSEIVMGRFAAWFGLPGVAWLTGAVIVAYAVTLYVTCRRWARPTVAVALAALALTASGDGLSGRPQVASYVLVTVVVGAWLRSAEDGRARWWLVAVAWVWPLLHGMWVLGLVTSAVAAVGIVLDRRRAARRVLGVPLAMALVSALTLLGPGIYGAVLLVGERRSHFTEWGPPDYTTAGPLFLAVLLAVALVTALRQSPGQAPLEWFPVLMLLLCGAWAVYSQRTVPVAAASAAPLAAMLLGRRFGRGPATVVRDRRVAMAMGAVSLAVLAGVVPVTASRPRPYPAWVDTVLTRLPLGTGLLVEDSDGSYLVWRYPRLAVSADGYGDTFTDQEVRRNEDLDRLAPGWESELDDTGIRRALLPDGIPLTHALETRGWRIARVSDGYEYLLAP